MSPCLRDLALKEEYRSGVDDLVASFFVPCLEISSRYDRAVGYFTSGGLQVAARGFEAFNAKGARARLVASPQLSSDDIEAIDRGLQARDDVVERRLLEALAAQSGATDGLLLLAWLVASDVLRIKLAIPSTGIGIYHEKVGIFQDDDGCSVAFAGSANETVGGLVTNFEALDVFFSWDSSSERVRRKSANFDSLWMGETPGLEVMELPDAVRRELVRLSGGMRSPSLRPASPPAPGAPPSLALRDYQLRAIEAWIGNGGSGILSMATGSGKTKTALGAAIRAFQAERATPRVVVIVPYIHLVDQWADELEQWGLRPIRCYEATRAWEPDAQEAIDISSILPDRPVVLVSTIKTATMGPFRRALDAMLRSRTLLIADEVHHLGADEHSKLLDHRYGWRLGLSATPARWHDEHGTALLESYFGGVVFEFGIRDAIAARCLAPYRYEPRLVDLDREELRSYRNLMERMEAVASVDSPDRADVLRRLLAERSNLLNNASGKIEALGAEVGHRRMSHTLMYCASRTQMGAVSHLLRDRGTLPRPFTAEEDRLTRADLLREFEDGEVPVIVAMKALDEGVDVPNIREAHLLASSGNPREFIQRRGRILRPAPGKTEAVLVDYVVVPDGAGTYERDLVRREMTRVIEFAESSMDPEVARQRVWPVLNAYGLLHLIGGG